MYTVSCPQIEPTRKIGEGSFGEVVLANFRGTKVAVKRMRGFEVSPDDDSQPSPTMMPVFASFFEREIEIMASIRHPNVVNFIGACHTPPNVCLVTEYCARGSLDHLLHKSGKRELATDCNTQYWSIRCSCMIHLLHKNSLYICIFKTNVHFHAGAS